MAASATLTWPDIERQCELPTSAIKLIQSDLIGDAADRIAKKTGIVEGLQQRGDATKAYVATRQVLAAAEVLRERSDFEPYSRTSAGEQFEDAMRRLQRKEVELRRLLEEQHTPMPQAMTASTSHSKPSPPSTHFGAASSSAFAAAPQKPSMEPAHQKRLRCMLPQCHARAPHAAEDCPRGGMKCRLCGGPGHYSRACPPRSNAGTENVTVWNQRPTSSTQMATSSSYSQLSTTTQDDPAARFRSRPKKQVSFADQHDETPGPPPPAAPQVRAGAPAPAEGDECCVCFEGIV
ncbi:hypothetical protein AAVH_38816, partial [Aphelenchoides avenae]